MRRLTAALVGLPVILAGISVVGIVCGALGIAVHALLDAPFPGLPAPVRVFTIGLTTACLILGVLRGLTTTVTLLLRTMPPRLYSVFSDSLSLLLAVTTTLGMIMVLASLFLTYIRGRVSLAILGVLILAGSIAVLIPRRRRMLADLHKS